ncbi:MAG: large conductance mechanosensitive channel protein MscL [Eubacterium sp.]|nr:large conductance mechanosensitive channel protein MscL [Eubacterium sp.]
MKKFLKEFKEFALQGNVISMAVGVIIGAAFKDLVTAFTDCFITPLLNLIGGTEFGGKIVLRKAAEGSEEIALYWGQFISAIINFLIMALILFCIIKAANKLMSLGKKKVEEAAPTTKKCPYCQSEIDINATKCPHCTSDLKD